MTSTHNGWKAETEHHKEEYNGEVDEWDTQYWEKDYNYGVTARIEVMYALYEEDGTKITDLEKGRKILSMSVDVQKPYVVTDTVTTNTDTFSYTYSIKPVSPTSSMTLTDVPMGKRYDINISWWGEITYHDLPKELEDAKSRCDSVAAVIRGIQ